MTPLHTYAQLRLDEYLHYPTAQAEAIAHYLELAMSERMKLDRERELARMMDRKEFE